MEEKEFGEFVELASAQGEMEAEILLGVLNSEGIEAMSQGDIAQGVHPFTVDGLGRIRILVRNEDLARARLVIREYRERE